VHPLVDLAVLAPVVRVTADLQHFLAADVLEIVLAVQRVSEGYDCCDLAAVDGVLAFFERAVDAARALRVAGEHDFGVGALAVGFAGEHCLGGEGQLRCYVASARRGRFLPYKGRQTRRTQYCLQSWQGSRRLGR